MRRRGARLAAGMDVNGPAETLQAAGRVAAAWSEAVRQSSSELSVERSSAEFQLRFIELTDRYASDD